MQVNKSIQIKSNWIATLGLVLLISSGCATNGPWTGSSTRESDFASNQDLIQRTSLPVEERLALLSGDQPTIKTGSSIHADAKFDTDSNYKADSNSKTESPATNSPATSPATSSVYQAVAYVPQQASNFNGPSNLTVRAQSADSPNSVTQSGGSFIDSSGVQQTNYQYPGSPAPNMGSPNIGSPNEANPLIQTYEGAGQATFPQNYADLDIYVAETQTGKINFGGAYNSDNGIVGQFIVDERNFDIRRFPRSFRDIYDGTAWRGGGQTFRLELVPGANLQRYLVSFSEPYFRGTDYSFSASGYLFERQYYDWDESRIGGRFSLGRRLTQDLSISSGVRLESVTLDNPRVNTSPELNASLGNSNLFLGNVGLIRDTRDHPFLATTGSYMALTYSQAFGDYSFARGDVDYRRYKLLYERPDGSGRHTLSFGTKAGFSGSSTPIFENYFAGGFSTLRGFDFRGAAPLEGGVRVGGEFQWLNTLEYMFPLTADDMIKAVVFCDFGTVEEKIELNADNFRVAPGFGFRIHMPAAGIGAPLAFDFAFPVLTADGDDEKMFSFYLGVLR